MVSVERKVYAKVTIKSLLYEKMMYTIDSNWGMCLRTYTLESQRNLAFLHFKIKLPIRGTKGQVHYPFDTQNLEHLSYPIDVLYLTFLY